MKIEKFALSRLRNETHYQFFRVLEGLVQKFPAVADLVGSLWPKLLALVVLESQLVDNVKASLYTEQIAAADSRRDRAIVGISAAIESALHHYDPAIVEAAHAVEIRLKAFHGSIEQKSYEQESAAVTILVSDLKTTYASQVTALGLGGWVTELAAAQTAFDSLFALRNEEREHTPQEKLHELRRQVDAAYENFTAFVNAYTLIDGDRDCGEFIGLLNQEIEYLKKHDLNQTKIDIAGAEPAPVEPQQYTGRHCTPVPDVLYVTKNGTVRLELGKDFNVAYKNNVEVGNAECTIHGKGAYCGHKTVTFIIKR